MLRVALAIATLLSLQAPAAAQSDSGEPAPVPKQAVSEWSVGVTEQQQAAALSHFERGNVSFGQKDYAGALEDYGRALAAWDHPAVRYNAAICHIHLGHNVVALKNLMSALRFGEAPFDANLFGQGKAFERLLRGQVATLTVELRTPGASATLDGRLLSGSASKYVELLEPGTHQLVVEKSGYTTDARRLELGPGAKKSIVVSLSPVLPSTGVARAVRNTRWPRWVPWTVFGAGLAVTAVGVPLQMRANSNFDSFDRGLTEQCPMRGCVRDEIPGELTDIESTAESQRTGAVLAFSVGAAVAVGGLVLLFLNQPADDEASTSTIGISASARGGSLSIRF